MLDGVFAGTVNLRHATERVGVLHVFLLSLDNLRAFQQMADMGGGQNLSYMRSYQMHVEVEGLDTSVEGFQGYCTNDVGQPGEFLGFQQQPNGITAHELGAVEQGQTFFRLQGDRFPAEFLVDFFSGVFLSSVVNFAHANQGQT